jgi:very-short-patch-repair endonuclease
MALRLQDLPQGTQVQLLSGLPEAQRKQSEASKAAEKFAFQLRQHRFGGWIREYRFAKADFTNKNGRPRQWAFDFANPELLLAVEIEGLRVQKLFERTPDGKFKQKIVCTGRHSTVDGYREDCVKYAAAVELGWHVLRFVQNQVRDGEAIATIERIMARRGVQRG